MSAPSDPFVAVRPYEPGDREAVRHICCETGYMGDPIAGQWRDAASYADLFTSYYTDREPESSFVATVDGTVAGFLLGCRETSKAGFPLAPLVPHIVWRGLAVRPGTARFIWRSLADGIADSLHGRLAPARVLDERWPSHLHIDLMPGARGHGAGRLLVTAWFDLLREIGSPGCHLETLAENSSAIAFFEAVGFRRRGEPRPVPGLRSPEGARHHVQLMVRDLAG